MRALLAVALVLAVSARAAPPKPGSEDAELMAGHEDWIKDQHNTKQQWCCDLSDGRPAELRRLADGSYEVHYTREHWKDGNDEWLPVPPEAILPQQSPIYVPIAWILRGRVYCVALSGAS